MAAIEQNVPFAGEGITALVTGASRGLGRAISEALAEAGASVVLVARSRGDLERTKGHVQTLLRGGARVYCIPADLSSESFETALEKELKKAGLRPDVLVNNAAIQGPIGPFWETNWQEWSHSFQLNAFAPARLCRLLIPGMIQRGWGKIITLSGGGATGPRPRFTAYGAAKTLLVRFMETLAEELKPHGIDANAIAPGAMKSAMTEAVIAAGPAKAGEKEYETARKLLQGTEEVVSRAARLCLFLSSHASDGITGKLLSAAWDPWETLPSHREELSRTDVYSLRRIVPSDRGLTWGSK
jgi:NAD(P)-dependent dehydrogenase (short-subunit alcohol dehydrogenase family)